MHTYSVVRGITHPLAFAAIGTLMAVSAGAQIGARVAAAPDGEVRMTYAARARACGDGNDVVAIGQALNVYSSMESYGRWSGVTCVPGPARVSITVRDHQVVGIRTRIGGSWRTGDGAVTDLGRVPAREAAAYFMSLAPAFTGSRRNPLLAAAVADSTDIAPDMLRLARDTSLSRETRRRAVNWAGALGDASMVRPLVELAQHSADPERHNRDDVGPGDGMRGAAIGALSMLEDGAGVPALLELARGNDPASRKAAVFWLGQVDDARGRPLLRTIVADANESEEIRGAAIFALGQGNGAHDADVAFLRDVFPRLPSERLKDRVLMAMSQSDSPESARWLVAIARNEQQPLEVRKKALFWAGQGHAQVADVLSVYTSTSDTRLREHVIFVLSQRDETAAIDALMHIARSDDDRRMRSKALFWLAQKNDPRVTQLITELVAR